jgi:hypothetical protein
MKTYMIISTSWSDKCVIEFTGKNVEAFNLLFNSQTMYTEEGWGTLLETNSKGKPVPPPSIKLATQSEVNDMIVKGELDRKEKIRAMLEEAEENEAAVL